MSAAAWERVRSGRPMPGLVEVDSGVPVGQAIEEIRWIVELSKPGEHEGRVLFLPL